MAKPPEQRGLAPAKRPSGLLGRRGENEKKRGGGFAPLRDAEQFARVRLVRGFGTIEWPGGVDLDPDSLYQRVRAGASE